MTATASAARAIKEEEALKQQQPKQATTQDVPSIESQTATTDDGVSFLHYDREYIVYFFRTNLAIYTNKLTLKREGALFFTEPTLDVNDAEHILTDGTRREVARDRAKKIQVHYAKN